MLFNSLAFILLFLPLTTFAYNLIRRCNVKVGKIFMILVSAYFYVYITYGGAPVLAASCLVSYLAYHFIMKSSHRKLAMIIGVSSNVIFLCSLKYNHFIPDGAFYATDWLRAYGMPLAISFFTFQQISFLVDAYKGKIVQVSILDYLYYILFFPKMIAGPITRWQALMPQTNSRELVKSSMVLVAMAVISIGLFKKVVLSGLFSRYADVGYANTATLNFSEAWITSFSYTAQIYFDFSGYSDIAIGAALLLGIRLPDNFNSPYKAVNIRDFWNRWHISLSTWLRDYVYIPLGGSRKGLPRTLLNLLVTFLISGAWHGSALNFIIWGALHGIATAVNVLWEKAGMRMPALAGWLVTTLFINFSWIPFRADSVQSAYDIFSAMLLPTNVALSGWHEVVNLETWAAFKSVFSPEVINAHAAIYIAIVLLFVFTVKNTSEIINGSHIGIIRVSLSSLAMAASVIFMFGGASAAQFIYSSF
ncbi:MBOAT family protein [Pantoea sp. BIGb0393]|uniref:Probable alginate O-acetylase n=1 Tax=Pantoea nemavictus TaxID=2726955 RepID=A0ABU8PNH6_9GAMM|nr:MBOAT family O-acyltransferase [Pantoea nemavictus]MBA0035307.1 MBOAT family protein [Pantoea nemavictus]